MGYYARLGIPEIWRSDGEKLTFHVPKPTGKYGVVQKSPSVPMITPAEIVHWTHLGRKIDHHGVWAQKLRRWVRTEIVPRSKGTR